MAKSKEDQHKYYLKRKAAKSKASRGDTPTVKEGGGFSYVADIGGRKRTMTFQNRNGEVYNVSDLADIPQKMNTSRSADELVKSMKKRGYEVTILSPAQMQARVDARNADREARKNIDYELGAGVPWGNKSNRRAARQGRLASRTAKRRR